MNDSRRPVTRSLAMLDRTLAFLILVMGIVMAFLTITTGNAALGLASLVFLAIGFVKLRDLIPATLKTVRRAGNSEPAAYQRVLLPVSRPEAVESMIRIAGDVLGQGGKLIVAHVIVLPPQLPSDADVKKDAAQALLKEASDFAAGLGIEMQAEIVTARTTTGAILDRVREHRCDLVILGSSQRTMPEKVLFGNVADHVLQRAPCDVMVLSYTKAHHPVRFVKILVPTAGYRHSLRALDVAADIGKREGGEITSLFVGQETDAARGNQILKEACARTEAKGVQNKAMFLTGNVADVITDTAKQGEYSLIIVGATEHPKYYTALLGNIADDVVKRAPCDVLVVRTRR